MKHSSSSYGLLAGLIAFCALWPSAALRADDNKEYLVKAAFIYNFVKFVDWPDGRAIAKQSNINICVLGSSPMSEAGSIFQKASTPQLTLSLVDEASTASAAAHCHVVFIGSSEAGNLSERLAGLKSHPVLTVSDVDGFAESGGMIGFVVADNKIKVVVNTKAAASAGLRIDAQLLEIALKVIR